MKITAIKAQVKNTERISIYVDEKYSFSLGYTQLLDQKLHVGVEVDDARIADLKHISDFGKAYERALNYAMIRPHSIREMRDYAWRKKWTPEDTEIIITKLIERRYLDDQNFARSWVENRMIGKKTSKRKLELELKQKGVASDIIKQALDQTDFDETSALKELIAKKRKLARYANDEQKLMQYLVRQGFSFDAVREALA